MDRIKADKKAWSLLAEDHYNSLKKQFLEHTFRFNPKDDGLFYLQCNN